MYIYIYSFIVLLEKNINVSLIYKFVNNYKYYVYQKLLDIVIWYVFCNKLNIVYIYYT